ncbi:phytanoyl-CoA dioxygenase family protein [Nocardioides sp. cx-169]|uniref:phytanoyl-CoA dioxygenase family protein n=1 Tax=Nocardioides sp. cx-169 TaxID=2899080 RepID=UPI001E5870B6|nr:phytanoyl-CoA dioxygenase family protein [Nocardioides sp. cx-169]MCD4536603.1 phytanoyl-CoA dioxygenase family protein [Nocardioides sp. cx-169]
MSTETLKKAPHEDRGLDTAYPITEEQIVSLHEDGWAPLPGLLDQETVAELRETLLGARLKESPVAGGGPSDPTQLLQHEAVAWESPFVHGVATSRRVSSAVTSLMRREDAVLCTDLSFFKPVGASPTPFHQDFSFWPFDRWGNVTVWIALVDITEDMGPLRYLKGSHREGPLGLIGGDDIREVYPQLSSSEIVGGKAMKAGDAQAHWELTVHGAVANNGESRREAVGLRYHRTDTRYINLPHTHYDKFKLTPGTPLTDSGVFPRVGPEGFIDGFTVK